MCAGYYFGDQVKSEDWNKYINSLDPQKRERMMTLLNEGPDAHKSYAEINKYGMDTSGQGFSENANNTFKNSDVYKDYLRRKINAQGLSRAPIDNTEVIVGYKAR